MNRLAFCSPCVALLLSGCVSAPPSTSPDEPSGQRVDASSFFQFRFDREVTRTTCFDAGDLLEVRLTTQVDNRLLEWRALETATDGSTCLTTADDGGCLVAGPLLTRILEPLENAMVMAAFTGVVVADAPNEVCTTGNLTTCSNDRYLWDDLELTGDACATVHLASAPDIMAVLTALRDGPDTAVLSPGGLDGGDPQRVVEVLRVQPLFDVPAVVDGGGDYQVIDDPEDTVGTALSTGVLGINFDREIGVVATVLRAPCQVFDAEFGVESLLTLDINGTLLPDEVCTDDPGGVEVYLIVVPRTTRTVRLFLNGTELRITEPQ